MTIISKQKNRDMAILVFSLLLLLQMFSMSTDQEKLISMVLPTVVPYVSTNLNSIIYYNIWFFALAFLYVINVNKNRFKIQIFGFGYFLLYRIIIGIVQIGLMYILGASASIRWGNYYLYIIEMLLYMVSCSIKYKDCRETYIIMYKIAVLIVSVETIWQAIAGILPQVSYVHLYYKACMNIPTGGSNVLAAIILPCLAAVLFEKKKFNLARIMYFVILTIAIVLTKSRSSMGLLVVVYSFLFYKGTQGKLSSKNSNYLIVGLFLLPIIIYLLFSYSSEIGTIIHGFSDFVDTGGILNRLSSGRLQIIGDYLRLIINHPVIGNGPNYIDSRAHNIIVDILYQNGIIGLVIFWICVRRVLKYSWANRFENEEISFFCIVLFISLVGSLVEITFFTDKVCDLFFIPIIAMLDSYQRNSRGQSLHG